MTRPTTNGLKGEQGGGLYDDLQPWAAELCEQAWHASLASGRRRGAARMDFVPGWKEAARQFRPEAFVPTPDTATAPAEEPPVPDGASRSSEPARTDAAVDTERACWDAIGSRPAVLVSRGTGTLHALRTAPRGYGIRRQRWEHTTECGMIFRFRRPQADLPTSPLGDTTCLRCRKVLRERFEDEILYGGALDDAGMDAYDAQHADDWWKEQAERHAPDPLLPTAGRQGAVTAGWHGSQVGG